MALIKSNNVPQQSVVFSMADIEQHARQVLARAEAQADQIIADANAFAAKARTNAAVEGKAAGIEQGRKEGREQAMTQARNQALTEQKAKLVETIGVLTKTAKELDTRMQSIQQEARTALLPLALSIARRVTMLNGERDPCVVEANVKEAVRLVMNKQSLRVAIHPTQKKSVESLLPQLKLQWPTMQSVELVEDPTIATGGCRVYSAGGMIDADLETQIDRIARELACDAKAETVKPSDDKPQTQPPAPSPPNP